jgi:hypothetical protein
MKAFKPLMFAILAGVPLATLPAMAESMSPSAGTKPPTTSTDSTTVTSDGKVYSQSTTTAPTPGMGPAGTSGNIQNGGESGGSGK